MTSDAATIVHSLMTIGPEGVTCQSGARKVLYVNTISENALYCPLFENFHSAPTSLDDKRLTHI